MDGSIESWNLSGFGVIRGADQKTYLAHFTDFDEYKQKQKRIMMEVGQDVQFTPGINTEKGGRAKAEDIRFDGRSPLFRFAYFYNFEAAVSSLATQHATPEKWSSSTFNVLEARKAVEEMAEKKGWLEKQLSWQVERFGNADEARARQRVEERIAGAIAKKQYEVLFSFFERTFERVQLEDKIVYSDKGAAFNTALGNKYNKDVYALFKKQREPRNNNEYEFEGFTDENHIGKHFPKIPEPPNYFRDVSTGARVPSDHLLFDYDLSIFPDYTHLLDERRSRFPDSWQGMNDAECAANFDQLLDRTRRRVRRNFRAAVPFYYPALRKIQMLLPLTFSPGTDDEETRALVVSREGAGYSVETVMPLEWAYKNARLVAKPDREDWLDF